MRIQVAPGQTAARNETAAPCICDPPVLVFKDIDVGTLYHKTVKITNTSSELQAFRVQEIPAEHASILDVKQDRFGFVSAGMSIKLSVSLQPEVEDDIDTEIGVLTDKGYCRVPVQILCKKAKLSVSTAVLDLGCILRGQKSTQHITLMNAGALQVCMPTHGCWLDKKRLPALDMNPTKVPSRAGQIRSAKKLSTGPDRATKSGGSRA